MLFQEQINYGTNASITFWSVFESLPSSSGQGLLCVCSDLLNIYVTSLMFFFFWFQVTISTGNASVLTTLFPLYVHACLRKPIIIPLPSDLIVLETVLVWLPHILNMIAKCLDESRHCDWLIFFILNDSILHWCIMQSPFRNKWSQITLGKMTELSDNWFHQTKRAILKWDFG